MGLLSSSKSSSSTAVHNVDKRLVVDGGSLGVSADHSTVSINTTDHGALGVAERIAGNAFNLAASSNVQTYKSLEGVLGLAGQASRSSLEASLGVREAFAKASDIAAGNKTLIAAGLAVVGLGVLVALPLMRKGA
jgi:hypothetical protein